MPMKSKVALSRFSTILTVVVSGVLFIGCIATVREKPAFFCLLAIYLILLISAMLYGAAYIKVDADHITLGSILRCKRISMRQVESAKRFQPTMGAIRIFASGGFMGYWGIFREGDIGRYYGFYGKASDCFLVRMKNGDKYVLGCKNPDEVVSYIRSQTGG